MNNDLHYKGKAIKAFRLTGANGMDAVVTNFGARIVTLRVADRNSTLRDVVQGFHTLADYLPENHASDFGAVIGRYANRIAGGRFTLDGKQFQLPVNNGPNCLHGGPNGWQYQVFDLLEHQSNSLTLRLISPDGDNAFPGTVTLTVRYTLTDNGALRIDYHATSDATTPFNVTNHSYFNLDGTQMSPADDGCCSLILDHLLTIDADRYTPTDNTAIPLAEHAAVTGTPMDFRNAKAIGKEIGADFEQLHIGHGYDHNYVLNTRGDLSRPCARLESPASGIVMELHTSQPGLQLYTGNFLDGVMGKEGVSYPRQSAVCLETQNYPDSPNRHWPESPGLLHAGEEFNSTTTFKFSTI
ncbi:MAG: galactose mutarotase [Bacteroidales bacterium]|nr:galactose mutarotase [Bacteroidales bacterium]